MSLLITPAQLDDLGSATTHILDVRWRLGSSTGRREYVAGHIPGAVYVDLETELAAPASPESGRHPLPDVAALQASARSWGVNDGDTVVVYDDVNNLSAARAWWLLRFAGIADVRVLDGALAGWTAAGFPLERRAVVVSPGGVTLSYGHLPVIDIDAAAGWPHHGVLLDARAGERYRGDIEPVDKKAGHIPGALSRPSTEYLDEAGRFLPADVLRERFLAAGVRPGGDVAGYCGSGVAAAHTVLALAVAGFDAALYPGSWSEWSSRSGRPVATGPTPGRAAGSSR
ncbi:MAG: sulfurtransferase [Cryobacterium sp.]